MTDGYVRRQERLEDLFILYNALPVYRGAYGKKAPSFKKLTEHRRKNKNLPNIDENTMKLWKDIQKEVQNNEQRVLEKAEG